MTTLFALILAVLLSLPTLASARAPADLATLCDAVANLGLSIAARSAELTPTQALDTLALGDPDYARTELFYAKLVLFVYERAHLPPDTLYLTTWQQCMDDYAPAPTRERSR